MLTVWSLNTESAWVIWKCTSKEQYIVREPDQSFLLSQNKSTCSWHQPGHSSRGATKQQLSAQDNLLSRGFLPLVLPRIILVESLPY